MASALAARTRKAQVARINRQLAKRYEKLCKSRQGSRLEHNIGEYYVLDTYKNAVIRTHVDLDELEKELRENSE